MTGSRVESTITLIEMMRVLFMRPDMFSRMGGMKNNRMCDKITKPINALLEGVSNAKNDEEVRAHVNAIIDNRDLVRPELG
jgi:hypothetical protein